jgi:hypothetical protein
MADGLPEEVRQFLRRYVSSIDQLEILLRLYALAPEGETSEQMAKALYLAPQAVHSRLEGFVDKGILVRTADTESKKYFISKSSDVVRPIEELARLYRERRVSVINEIFSNPIDAIQTYADAFILGKKKD